MARLSQRSRVLVSPSSRWSTESPPLNSSARKRNRSPPSSRREVVEESDDELDTQHREHDDHAETLQVKDGARKTKKPRLLAELQTSLTLTPEPSLDVPLTQATSVSSTSRTTGLKVPTKDDKATRRSERSSALKPVLYNMKIHPQDHSLPFRRTQESMARFDQSDSDESVYDASHDTGKEDTVRAEDTEQFLDDDTFATSIRAIPRVPTRNPKATRLLPQRPARKAVNAVNYDMTFHPMDDAIDWSVSKRRRRQVLDQNVDSPEHSLPREEEASIAADDEGSQAHHDIDDELLHDFAPDDSGSVELGESIAEAYLPSHTTSKTLSAGRGPNEDVDLDEIVVGYRHNLQRRANDIPARRVTDVASLLAAATGPSSTLQMLSNNALTDTVTSTSISDRSLVPEWRPSDSQRQLDAIRDIAAAPKRLRRQSNP